MSFTFIAAMELRIVSVRQRMKGIVDLFDTKRTGPGLEAITLRSHSSCCMPIFVLEEKRSAISGTPAARNQTPRPTQAAPSAGTLLAAKPLTSTAAMTAKARHIGSENRDAMRSLNFAHQ